MKCRAGLLTAIVSTLILTSVSAPVAAQAMPPVVYNLVDIAPGNYLTRFPNGEYYWITVPPGVHLKPDTLIAPYITGRYIPPQAAPAPPPQQTIVVVQPPPADSIGLSFGFSRIDLGNGRRR